MTELWGLRNDSGTVDPPAAAADFLLSHDSADAFGAAWLYTMSNGCVCVHRQHSRSLTVLLPAHRAPPHSLLHDTAAFVCRTA